jgi:serine phosphatase RsbU (regulator of sigma subunit)
VEVVDAGSPRAWRLRAGAVEALRPDAQMPLGMFGDTVYQSESWHVEPKDRLLIVSDGVYAVASAAGDTFDKQDLARTLRATRMLPPAQVPGAVLREVAGYHGGILKDDALVMCIDWHGRPSA